jgi:glycosyltransferase involved in cell wall biosynthesis
MGEKGKILIIDFTNYEDYPIGGYLSFARSLMESFGNSLALAGITTSDEDPVGRWFRKEIEGTAYDFFAFARYSKTKTRHLLPDRLVGYVLVKYFQNRIFKININNVFIQRHEILLSLRRLKSKNLCFCFAGLENPLSISKYSYGPGISRYFEIVFFRKLRNVRTILASGDDNAINEMIIRSRERVLKSSVVKFPTRISTDIFKPIDKQEARNKLGLPDYETIVLTTGRLAKFKGWKFMIDSFRLFMEKLPESSLRFIGEGEDYEEIKAYLSNENLSDKITLEGRKSQQEIALFLNASDLFIMGSYKEGWSTSLMEAIACGVPSCVTDFSSAREIIIEGEGGYAINDHNEAHFAEGMLKALKLTRPVRNDHVIKYSTQNLKGDLLNYWTLS